MKCVVYLSDRMAGRAVKTKINTKKKKVGGRNERDWPIAGNVEDVQFGAISQLVRQKVQFVVAQR